MLFLATGGLIGFAPAAPGTFGSLAALPLCWSISLLHVESALMVVLLLTMLSIWIAQVTETVEAQKDPKQVVIDEVCGMAVALFALPFNLFCVIGGFALFRVFDILKPFPIRWVEKHIPGGAGVVLDDIIAGMFTNVLLRMGIYLLSR